MSKSWMCDKVCLPSGGSSTAYVNIMAREEDERNGDSNVTHIKSCKLLLAKKKKNVFVIFQPAKLAQKAAIKIFHDFRKMLL